MRIEKLFKVLVVGGSVLTAGCGGIALAPAATGEAVSADAGVVDGDGGVADAGPVGDGGADAGGDAPEDRGVFAWLSWV